jgi:hypothetical protein
MRTAKSWSAVLLSAAALSWAGGAWAQSFVIDSYYDCQRATNGRAYCKRVGRPANYEAVSDAFFARYTAARTGQPLAPAVVVQEAPTNVTNQAVAVTNNVVIINGLKSEASEVRGQIELMTKVLEEQKALRASAPDAYVIDETISVLEGRIKELKGQFREKTVQLSKYLTSIKPDDAEMQITARRESEIYPKVPYYIPGTRETGEFWVEPMVSDTGALVFNLRFVDVASSAADKIRSTISMTPQQLDRTRAALVKASQNSRLAHQKRINRKLETRIDCFPSEDCPPEGQKLDGRLSTEIIFAINEDGSTNARIQRNKGRFEEGYNVSIASGHLLQAYINHVLKAGKDEYEMGSTSTEDLKNLFR